MTPTPLPTPTPAAPKRRWLLITSLALNMLFVGTIGGAVFARHRMATPDMFGMSKGGGEPGMRAFFRSLPQDRRPTFRPFVEQVRMTVRPLRQSMQRAREAARLALVAEPFDRARFETATNELLGAEAATRRAMGSILASALTAMTPQERLQFHTFRQKSGSRGVPPPVDDDAAPVPPTPAQSPNQPPAVAPTTPAPTPR